MMSATGSNRKEAYGVLHRFYFSGDDLEKQISDLSGGERNRLQIGVSQRTGSDTVMSSGRSDARKDDEIHAGGPSSRSPEAADGCPQP